MGHRTMVAVSHCSTFILLVVGFPSCIFGSNILMVTLAGTKSHKIPFLALAQGLLSNSHNLTFVNPFPPDHYTNDTAAAVSAAVSNTTLVGHLEEINPPELVSYVHNFTNWDLLGARLRGEMPVPITDVFKYAYQACEAFFSDSQIKNLMLRKRKRRGDSSESSLFDLVILDGAYPECGVALAYHFKAPFVYVNTVGFYTGSISLAGNPSPYSVTPFFGLAYSDDMNMAQRLINAAHHVALSALHAFVVGYFVHPILRNYVDPNIPSPYQMSRDVSLIFQNGHFSLTYPRPFLPSVVEVACLHCHEPKPLPKHLENFINSGSNGFIFVSMGSSVRASNMPATLRSLFLNVFAQLPYQILWKWETAPPTPNVRPPKNHFHVPSNVLLADWFPQQDILGHPKIKAFITHGGLLSLFETVYHAVPVVAVPVFCDHDSNVEKAVRDGYAIRIQLQQLTVQKLYHSVTTIISNKKYKNKCKIRSRILRDQMESPIKRAVFWTEYVIRHKGAPEMSSPAKDMNILQYYSVDIILLFIVLAQLMVYLIFVFVKFCSQFISTKHYVKIKLN